MDITFVDNQLVIKGDSVLFTSPIKDIKMYNDLVLVLLTVPKGTIDNQNVFAVNVTSKEIVWRIQEPDLIYDKCPYTNFDDFSQGIVINNWNGIEYTISEKDGSRIHGVLTK